MFYVILLIVRWSKSLVNNSADASSKLPILAWCSCKVVCQKFTRHDRKDKNLGQSAKIYCVCSVCKTKMEQGYLHIVQISAIFIKTFCIIFTLCLTFIISNWFYIYLTHTFCLKSGYINNINIKESAVLFKLFSILSISLFIYFIAFAWKPGMVRSTLLPW